MREIIFSFAFISVFSTLFESGYAIQCYQCDSNEDQSCPATRPFDKNLNAWVDCNSFEARTPGTFCMKITQQSPGWRAWKKVTRRCGSRSDTGVAWGCRWEYEPNGVWKESCYCEDKDGCNTATSTSYNLPLMTLLSFIYVLVHHLTH